MPSLGHALLQTLATLAYVALASNLLADEPAGARPTPPAPAAPATPEVQMPRSTPSPSAPAAPTPVPDAPATLHTATFALG